MNWPAIVKFDNSDVLEIIENQQMWNEFSANLTTDCTLISADSMLRNITTDTDETRVSPASTTIALNDAILIARKHIAAQAHCCVSKFNAASVAEVIDALVKLEEEH